MGFTEVEQALIDQYPDCAHDITDMSNEQMVHYVQMRIGGEGHNLSSMCALRRAPGCMTDREFFSGIGTLENQFNTDSKGGKVGLEGLLRLAKMRGYRPSPNDVYVPQLANGRGDPEAFVPATGGRGHIRKVLEKRGWGSEEGVVKVKSREPLTDPREKQTPLAPDLVRENAIRAIRKDSSLKRIPKRELAAKIVEEHAPKGY